MTASPPEDLRRSQCPVQVEANIGGSKPSRLRQVFLCVAGAIAVATAAGPVPAAATDPAETRVYERVPLRIELPVGRERIVTFEGEVQPGLPRAIASKVRIQTVGDTLYVKALQPFDEVRMPVRDRASGQILLLDLVATEEAPDERIQVLSSDTGAASLQRAAASAPAAAQPIAPLTYGYAEMTRFAAQSVYAPDRLIEPLEGVVRVPVTDAGLPLLVQGGFLEASALASWREPGGLHVTAVRLQNRTGEPLRLDPRLIRGRYETTTLHHQSLGPRGASSDTTVAYVTHQARFEEAARPWAR